MQQSHMARSSHCNKDAFTEMDDSECALCGEMDNHQVMVS